MYLCYSGGRSVVIVGHTLETESNVDRLHNNLHGPSSGSTSTDIYGIPGENAFRLERVKMLQSTASPSSSSYCDAAEDIDCRECSTNSAAGHAAGKCPQEGGDDEDEDDVNPVMEVQILRDRVYNSKNPAPSSVVTSSFSVVPCSFASSPIEKSNSTQLDRRKIEDTSEEEKSLLPKVNNLFNSYVKT